MKIPRFLLLLPFLAAPSHAVTLTVSANMDTFLTAANYAAMRTQLSLVVGTNVQAYDADLTAYAGITPAANTQSLLGAANYAAMRALLDLEAGTDFNAYDADLATWATVTPGTGVGTFLATPSSANFRGALTDESGTGVFLTVNGVGAALTLTASGFDGNLATTDDTLQEVAQKVDDMTAGSGSVATDTLWNAAGDLAYGTGSDTATRLGIGTAGQILQVNTGATAPEWTSAPSVSTLGVSGTATIGSMSFEGATADANETALAVTDPTADRTITLPDATGTVALTTSVETTQTGVHATPSTTNPLAPTWTGPTQLIWYGATGEIDLPAASGYAGRGLILYNTGAFTVTFDPNASEVIVRDGTVQTGGVSFTLSSGAGNYVALVSDGARWITLGYKGTLTVGS